MAFTTATATDLKTRLPRFADVADATVDVYLDRARRSVDDSWAEGDQVEGQVLLAAHLMTLEGLGTGTEAELNAEGLGDIRTLKSGSLSFTRQGDGNDGQSAAGKIGSTSYGRQWLELLRSNRGGSRITPTGVIPTSPLYPSRFPQ